MEISPGLGNALRHRGNWDAATAYQVGDAVRGNGGSYYAVAPSTNVVPGTDPNTWTVLALDGQPEIAYAQIVAPYTVAGDVANMLPVPALQVTVPQNTRPVYIEAGGPDFKESVVTSMIVGIMDMSVATSSLQTLQQGIIDEVTAGKRWPWYLRYRVPPGTAQKTYGVVLYSGGGGNLTLDAGAADPAWISATQH